MKIVYYTSGMTGSGRVVRGIAIANACARKRIDCEFTIVSSSRFGFLAEGFARHIEIPAGDEHEHSKDTYSNSAVYSTLAALDPDILIVDLLWFPLHHFIREMKCKKLFLFTQISNPRFFKIELPGETLQFSPEYFDLLLQAEPLPLDIGARRINPIVLRNRDEILSQSQALDKLKLEPSDKPNCLFAYNGEPGEYEAIREKYSYLEEEYRMVHSSNYSGTGFFPIVDYYNAFDFIVSGAGYNAFWEIIYFDKEAVFEPVPRQFEDQTYRIRECQEFYFDENGADQLADIIMGL